MAQSRTTELTTLTVMSSEMLAHPDGRVAIRLDTEEAGSIAFEVDRHAIDTLQRQLAVADQILRQSALKN
jgi:hypothetical protein